MTADVNEKTEKTAQLVLTNLRDCGIFAERGNMAAAYMYKSHVRIIFNTG